MTESVDDTPETTAASRRAFLLGAAGVTGVAVAAGTTAWRTPAAQAASDGRSYASGYFALKLDDINCGLVEKFEGGDIEGEVVTEPVTNNYYAKKHIGNPKYNEFAISVGFDIGRPVKDWIESTLQGKFLRKSRELQAADFKRDIGPVREFHDALLTEIGFPACDASAKDRASMSLKFQPETTRNKKGSGKLENPGDRKQKQFFPSNFRLTIDGLEAASAKVSKVDALVIKQTTATNDVGDSREQHGPGKLEYPNLRITVSEEYAHDFWAWHEDFVVRGNNDDTKEKQGSLQLLDSTGRNVLLTLRFQGLGIFKIAEASENNADKIRRFRAEMYVERMSAKFDGTTPGARATSQPTTTSTTPPRR